MALIEQIGEMTQKGNTKQFNYYQVEHFEDVEALIETIGPELFVEALNTGLETIGRKRVRSNSDPKLTNPQLIQIRRMRDLVAMQAFTMEQALDILVNQNGFDEELARKNLVDVGDGED